MPASSESTAVTTGMDSSPKLKDTVDTFQKTFRCTLAEICVWRRVLLMRYSSVNSERAYIQFQHRDATENELSINDQKTPLLGYTAPPEDLVKSVIRLFVDDHKAITYTVYIKYQEGTGTFLAQRTYCPVFAKDEVELLTDLVAEVQRVTDPTPELEAAFQDRLAALPLPLEVLNTPSHPESPTPHKLHMADGTITPNNGPDRSDDEHLEVFRSSPLTHVKRPHAIRTSRRRNHRPLLSTTPLVLNRLTRVEEEMNEISNHATDLEASLTATVNDAKASIITAFKVHLSSAESSISSAVTALTTRVEQLEKDNHRLKTLLGDAKREIASLKELRRTGVSSIATQTAPIPPPQNASFPLSNSHTPPISAAASPSGTSCRDALERDAVPTGNSAAVLCKDDGESEQHDCDEDRAATQLNDDPIIASGTCADGITNDATKRDDMPSPGQRLQQANILSNTQVLLIGDSIPRPVDATRMVATGITTQKICVSGLSVEDLEQWLPTQPPRPRVRQLTVHVGCNSCQEAAVEEETWMTLLKACKRAFPNAVIRASSIVPARGQHPRRDAILSSNSSLRTACSKLKVKCIDHTDTFLTERGAPRKKLYRDGLHPSSKGTRELALNLTDPDRSRELSHFSGPYPSSSLAHPRSHGAIRQHQPGPDVKRRYPRIDTSGHTPPPWSNARPYPLLSGQSPVGPNTPVQPLPHPPPPAYYQPIPQCFPPQPTPVPVQSFAEGSTGLASQTPGTVDSQLAPQPSSATNLQPGASSQPLDPLWLVAQLLQPFLK
ncbi:hypothetical protein BaRGS_00011691 [Batillaria attramentaria]|uniref:Uncharacterized protein n=1 Tax=Batillaria attramentaria TaxID=370345 RepID=A0ABD0LDD7_9CAEN